MALNSYGQQNPGTLEKRNNVDSIYVPINLDDCLRQLDTILVDSVKIHIKSLTEDQFSGKYHHGLGTWMRNNWGLWKGSRLSKYFNEKGIFHPDDMSGIILDSYHRSLTGREINLDQQVKYYQDYWKIVSPPLKDSFPKGVKKLEFKSGMYYDSKLNKQGFVHIGRSRNSKEIWLYDYNLGWTKVTEVQIKKLEQNPDTREDILIEIFQEAK